MSKLNITALDQAREIPWRPGYRNFILAGKDHGISSSCSMGLIEPGAGAPLHYHEEDDEVILVLEGELEFRIGEETCVVTPNHVVAIPKQVPHSFVVLGDKPARIVGFLPRQGAYVAAKYLGGNPPLSANLK
ncbi:MAG: cupin domain-containing protein [Burkholderiaceae bacterium]|nr:cupin domain-containing protein [Burkholderiaceae bacterium]